MCLRHSPSNNSLYGRLYYRRASYHKRASYNERASYQRAPYL